MLYGRAGENIPRFCLMTKGVKYLRVFAALLLPALLFFLLRPAVLVTGDAGTIAAVPCRRELPITIRFIHSVQKTPVEEDLALDHAWGGFVLKRTRYQSFGVGLPFLESEGNFRHEGDYFVLDGMERHFPSLSLRTGVGTQLTLMLDGQEYRLYEKLPPGSRINLLVAPYYKALIQ